MRKRVTLGLRGGVVPIEIFINHDKHHTAVRPELVEGLRQAQPERQCVMNNENINRLASSPVRLLPCIPRELDSPWRSQNQSRPAGLGIVDVQTAWFEPRRNTVSRLVEQ